MSDLKVLSYFPSAIFTGGVLTVHSQPFELFSFLIITFTTPTLSATFPLNILVPFTSELLAGVISPTNEGLSLSP